MTYLCFLFQGPVQICSLGISFITLNITSSEWNYYWLDVHQPTSIVKIILRTMKVTPFFLIPIMCKTMSWALLVTILGYYSLIILLAVLVYQYVIQKKVGFYPQHIMRGIFYNLCTTARPATHSTWNSEMVHMFRLDTYGSICIHGLCLCIATSLYDIFQWDLNVCAFPWFKANLSILARGVIILGFLNGAVAELYLNFLPHIVLQGSDIEGIESDMNLQWGVQKRYSYMTSYEYPFADHMLSKEYITFNMSQKK